MPQDYSHALLDEFLVGLMACNAHDGTACDMLGVTELRAAFLTACALSRPDPSPRTLQEELMARLAEACVGPADKPLAPARPAPPPFSNLMAAPLGLDEISTVVTASTLVRLISPADKGRFDEKASVRFNASGSPGPPEKPKAYRRMISRLARAKAEERFFTLAPDGAHGRPYVWFTTRADVESVLEGHQDAASTKAEVLRDKLGLIHHGPKAWNTNLPNHLFILHMPATVAVKAGYMRPTVLQGFDNRRFVLRLGEHGPPRVDAWGRTLDLNSFASHPVRPSDPSGGRERVMLRLQSRLLAGKDQIKFDYLGTINTNRGIEAGIDDDFAFLSWMSHDRDLDDLITPIFAPLREDSTRQ